VRSNTGSPILDVREVSKVYRRGALEVHALHDTSFAVEPGETLAIMGPSGSGKTTLLNILGGLDRPTRGEVIVAGERLSGLDADAATVFRRRHIGFIFQFFNLLPTITAVENVALPLLAERVAWRAAERRAAESLEAVGMDHRAGHRPGELSGGEQQRVAIARALIMRPGLLLADEPTGNLDSTTGDQILALLRHAVVADGLAIVMVTHSQSAARAADRILTVCDGRLSGSDGGPHGAERALVT